MTRLRPVLDDVTYAELVAAARARIPALAPGWTDHNAGDPGIVLVELFAWLSEMLIYQADQLPAERTDAFLRLLNGPGWTRTGDLDAAVATTLAALRAPWRAATSADVVHLLTRVWPDGSDGRAVRRVLCVPDRDLTAAGPDDGGARATSAWSWCPRPTATGAARRPAGAVRRAGGLAGAAPAAGRAAPRRRPAVRRGDPHRAASCCGRTTPRRPSPAAGC